MAGLIGYRDQVAPAPTKGRVGPLRDIRKFIAQSQTKQMDPNEFPPYEYRRYPLMPRNKDGKPFFDTVGRAIVLRNPDDEEAFYKDYPDAPRVPDPEDVQDELQRLRAENARLKAKEAGSEEPEPGANGGNKKDKPRDGDEPPLAKAAAAGDKPQKNGVAGLTREPPKPKPGTKLD